MKIVVLDGFTTNPGDLSWEGLNQLGEVMIWDRTPADLVVERSKGAEILLTNKVIIGEKEMAALPDLKYIGVMATGYNVIDVEAANQRGIVVTNVRGYSTDSVAQHAFAMILNLYNQVAFYDNEVKKDAWKNSVDFSFWKTPLRELSGKTFGVVGFGTIGQRTAEIAKAFGMKVISSHKHPERDKKPGVEFVSIDELFRKADIVSLHCPLNEDNKGFVNTQLLRTMKSEAIIINTARGPLINHDDLADALEQGIIAGAGLDVYLMEPPTDDHRIFKLPNCAITPHQAWATQEARRRLLDGVIENILSYSCNNPINTVN